LVKWIVRIGYLFFEKVCTIEDPINPEYDDVDFKLLLDVTLENFFNHLKGKKDQVIDES